MTLFTVVWDKEVEDSFINAWLEADSPRRATLTDIANWIDRELAVGPETKGQPLLEPGSRVVEPTVPDLTSPVSVQFRVFPDDRLVRVTLVSIRDH